MNKTAKKQHISIALVSLTIVLAFIFTGFGYPGFLLSFIAAEQEEDTIINVTKLNGELETDESDVHYVAKTGNSQPFSITPQEGVTISAEENALDQDREFKLEQLGNDKVEELNNTLADNNISDEVVVAWDLDAGLADNERFPGTYHVDLDLAELGFDEEDYPAVSAYRVDDQGLWYEYACLLEGSHLSFDASQNSILAVVITTAILGMTASNEFGALTTLYGFNKISCYEKGVGVDDEKNLGRKLYNIKIRYGDAVDNAQQRKNDKEKSLDKNLVEAEAAKRLKEKFGDDTSSKEYDTQFLLEKRKVRAEMLKDDPEYVSACGDLAEAYKKEGLDLDIIKEFGAMCVDSYNYLKDVVKVKIPTYVVDIYMDKDYAQGGVTVTTYPRGHCYVVIQTSGIVNYNKGSTEGHDKVFLALVHELFHVSTREYCIKTIANTKFDEATAQMIEYDAFEYFSKQGKLHTFNTENADQLQYYFVPFDKTSTYIDGESRSSDAGAGDQGYPLAHFIMFVRKKYKPKLTYNDLLSAYDEYTAFPDYSELMKTAFGYDDASLSNAYKMFARDYQVKFYNMAAGWYEGNNHKSSWAESKKGPDQGEHAVIKNQSYQLSVRRLYPSRPPEGINSQISVLLAYDKNYKELTDFELIPVGNKDYMNTKYGIMYKPKQYTAMNKLYTMEVDGGSNDNNVKSGYTVWTLFAPKPIGTVTVKNNMLNFKLPEKSDAAKAGYIDGYRVTITCSDDTVTEKYYKISGSGKEISLKAKSLKAKDSKMDDVSFKVSVCEYIKEANGDRSYGPESDPSNSIVDSMNETLTEMGAADGAITVALGWQTADDLDLHVLTPSGSEIYFGNKETGGGKLDVDMQVSDIVASPAEHVVFPAPDEGTYTVYVNDYTDRTENSASPYVVVVKVGSKSKTFRLAANGGKQKICSFKYGGDEEDERGNEFLDDN